MTVEATRMGLRETLRTDMRVMEMRSTGIFFMIYCLFRRPDFLAVFLYRLSARYIYRGKLGKAFAAFLERLNSFVNGCDINPEAIIGPGFRLTHPVGVVIGMATIGSNVAMLQNSTLGVRRATDDGYQRSSYPVVGDNVFISAGAVVAGNVKIGSGATVGANSVVLEDVPENCTVVGVPARILGQRKELAS